MSYVFASGFESGLIGALGTSLTKFCDYVTGTPAVISTSPKTGTFCLEIAQTAATEAVGFDTNTLGGSKTRGYSSFHVYFPSSLPAADVHLALWFSASGATPAVTFNFGTSKLAVRWNAGTETDGPSIVANTWYRVETVVDVSPTAHTLNWWVDGVAQTTITDAVSSASTLSGFELGDSAASQTMTARYDNLVLQTETVAISDAPKNLKVVGLTPDGSGTLVLSGTSTNWRTYTANGTYTAWNAATALSNLTDTPPVIGASSTGLVQFSPQSSDNVTIPMTTYTLAGGESIVGGRCVAVGFALDPDPVTNPANLGFRSYNGTTETILQAGSVNPHFSNSTTDPGFYCKMLTLADIDTQAELDGLCFRVGYSSDATPDIGIHGIYAEIIILVGSATSVNAGVATGTGVVGAPTESIAPHAAANSGTGTANAPAPSVNPSAGLTSGTGSANAPTLSLSSGVPAGLASGTGTSNAPSGSVKPSSGVATGSGTSNSPTVTAASNANVSAGLASGTGSALSGSSSISMKAALASGSGTANAAVGVASLSHSALAECATATGSAYDTVFGEYGAVGASPGVRGSVGVVVDTVTGVVATVTPLLIAGISNTDLSILTIEVEPQDSTIDRVAGWVKLIEGVINMNLDYNGPYSKVAIYTRRGHIVTPPVVTARNAVSSDIILQSAITTYTKGPGQVYSLDAFITSYDFIPIVPGVTTWATVKAANGSWTRVDTIHAPPGTWTDVIENPGV